MSLYLQSTVARAAIRNGHRVFARNVHVENTVGNNMPFKYEGRPKAFAVKLVLFLGTGFAIPFVAAAYQLKKSKAQ